MKTREPQSKRVLAIDPSTQGFGYIVLESPSVAVDWGTKVIRRTNHDQNLAKVAELIEFYHPKILAIEEPNDSRRCARIQRLLEAICQLPTAQGLKIRRFPISRVKKVFRAFRAETKF